MSANALQFIQRWVVTTLAVLVAAKVVNSIKCNSVAALIVASLLLGFLNAFVRPLLLVISLPLLISTLGLFMLVINALLLWLVGSLGLGFTVPGFWPAFWGALVISVVSMIANLFLGRGPRVQVKKGRGRRDSGGDDGPVIDV
jgi:putative membrane protein